MSDRFRSSIQHRENGHYSKEVERAFSPDFLFLIGSILLSIYEWYSLLIYKFLILLYKYKIYKDKGKAKISNKLFGIEKAYRKYALPSDS